MQIRQKTTNFKAHILLSVNHTHIKRSEEKALKREAEKFSRGLDNFAAEFKLKATIDPQNSDFMTGRKGIHIEDELLEANPQATDAWNALKKHYKEVFEGFSHGMKFEAKNKSKLSEIR